MHSVFYSCATKYRTYFLQLKLAILTERTNILSRQWAKDKQ
jgi:hypothetical protein